MSMRRVVGVLLVLTVPTLAAAAQPVDFERDIQPILTRYGCNSGACHGKQRGQNGFQLSLFGFDSDFDHAALTREARARRVNLARPEDSLLLLKATATLPHGGGKRLEPGGAEEQLLLQWLRAGAPRRVEGTPALVKVTVEPSARQLREGEAFKLTVTAHYDDGKQQDVTRLTNFQSSEATIADVDETGRVQTGGVIGEAAIVARFSNHFAICSVSVPLPDDVPADYYASLPRANFIDGHVWEGLQRLNLKASPVAEDHKFLRRATVDIIGRLPTAEEARAFLDDTDPGRRERVVDALLASPEYAEHWANKWADLLRPNPYRVGIKATLNYDAWIREQFRNNVPYDQFVRDLITAQGSTFQNGAVTLFRDRRAPDELATIVSQLFLGIRLECAKCHHHPFEVYGQDDFYSFAAWFGKIGRKGTGLSPPISGSEEFIFAGDKGDVRHPLTNEILPPRPLFGDDLTVPEGTDPRVVLADWMTSTDNPYFAQTMANRVWADLMGRGLVEPVDDLRATNPPVNAPLLEALGREFANSGYDLKFLIRQIVLSNAYRLSSTPSEGNEVDNRAYSRHYRTRLRAEVLHDSLLQITGTEESFTAMPPGSHARELWTHRIGSLFLDAYGRPDPNQDPPCERVVEPTVVQTLHLMNSQRLMEHISNNQARPAKLAESDRTPKELIEEIYLWVYSRRPTEKELQISLGLYENEEVSPRQATEDLLWTLVNTPEFVFKD